MRIIAGKYGGRKIHLPSGRDIRPTSDKVRGAIFNALVSRGLVDGAVVLDGFCGSGALGLEALSRGAAGCTFIDKSRASLDLAQKAAGEFGVTAAEFLLRDVTTLGPRPENVLPATLIFLDPPYEQNLAMPALKNLHDQGWLADGAMIVVEVEKRFSGEIPAPYQIADEKLYGETRILYLR